MSKNILKFEKGTKEDRLKRRILSKFGPLVHHYYDKNKTILIIDNISRIK